MKYSIKQVFRVIDFVFIIVGFFGIVIFINNIIKHSTADDILSTISVMIGLVSIFIVGYLRFDREKFSQK